MFGCFLFCLFCLDFWGVFLFCFVCLCFFGRWVGGYSIYTDDKSIETESTKRTFVKLELRVMSLPGNSQAKSHYTDATMSPMASQITSLWIVYSTVYSSSDQRKHHSSASLAFVRGIHRGPVNSPHKRPVTRKMFSFDDVIMCPVLDCRRSSLEVLCNTNIYLLMGKSSGFMVMGTTGPCILHLASSHD